ncbi:MAG: hypothetical protein Q4A84_07350 [Neisseria sp.]|uniref:hypothetical protein n=1 Tax=Neisseria sp. TaxID=192066 RepID=UPI0026DD44C3|nr:hypothetical protein [Neisseria sp.]MDO4641499.1 hypothetical protein [Neisseria sp.]
MKDQQELPDSLVLAVIIVLILGTISYFIYGQWQVIEEMQHSANEVSAKQVAEKMEKERAELRAVSDGKKTLEDLDKEHAASEEAGKKSGSVSLKSLWSKDAKAASK